MTNIQAKKAVGSIRDVARETGLSIATVSRVVNGSAKVSPETQKRVLEACERLDYLPNPAARALSTRKSKTVAAIIPTIEHSVFSKFIAAIERTLGEQGYSLVLAISNADPDEEYRAALKLLGMGAEAFILSGAVHSQALVDLFNRRNVLFVYTSFWEEESTRPTIGYDNSQLAADGLRHLIDLGHSQIGVIHGPLDKSDRTEARKAGAVAACPGHVSLEFFETEISVAGGKQATQEALSRDLGCTALFCFSDVLALGAYFALAEAGLSVPQDMSVMGFDNLDWADQTVPPLTTIDLPAKGMGEAVAKQILDNLENGKALEWERLDAQIIERASVSRHG